MKCNTALDITYQMGDPLPLWERMGLALHVIFCSKCAGHLNTYLTARSLLATEFFPPSPDFSDVVMNRIYREAEIEELNDEAAFGHAGFSTKGWVIAGIVMLISLATAFFGQDFASIALNYESSFLLPMGIIIGVVISGYGALFIGSHLKEFSARFKL